MIWKMCWTCLRENLVQLKEEAGMVREDTLMRFIRILSDLSEQMRYAGSKRVLLEVALIKLCRPAMETDEISVLERVRVLEKQLDPAMMVQQAPAGLTATRRITDQDGPVCVRGGLPGSAGPGNALEPEELRKRQRPRICRR